MGTNISIAVDRHRVEACELARTDLDVDLSVRVSGQEIGVARLPSFFETRSAVLNADVLLWAGVRIYRVDPETRTLERLDWDDEVRQIVPYANMWCVQGELTVVLYEPTSRTVMARYDHNEVIVDVERSGDRLLLTDFNGNRVVLNLKNGLRPFAA